MAEASQNLDLIVNAHSFLFRELLLFIDLHCYFPLIDEINSTLDQCMCTSSQIAMELYIGKEFFYQFFLFLFQLIFFFILLSFNLDFSTTFLLLLKTISFNSLLLLLLFLRFNYICSFYNKRFIF